MKKYVYICILLCYTLIDVPFYLFSFSMSFVKKKIYLSSIKVTRLWFYTNCWLWVLCKGLCLCKHWLSQVFSLTGLDDCRHVFKQEIQETAPHVYSQPVLSTGKDTLWNNCITWNFLSVNPQICCFCAVSSFCHVLGWSFGTLWWKRMTSPCRSWLSHYYLPHSTVLLYGQVCCEYRKTSNLNCGSAPQRPVKVKLLLITNSVTTVLFRVDRTLPCAYKKIWGSESFAGHVGDCRLGVSHSKEEMKLSWFASSTNIFLIIGLPLGRIIMLDN